MLREIAQPQPLRKDFLDLLWDFFSSVRMAIWLLSVSAVAILVGTVVEQNQPPAKYAATYGPTLAHVMQVLSIGDLYHNWWFEVLMSLVCVNLILSNFNRAEKILKKYYHPTIQMEQAYFENAREKIALQTSDDLGNAATKLENTLSSLGYRWKKEKIAETFYYHAHKGILALWGSTVAHAGLLLLFVAVIYGHWPGQSFERNAALLEGDSYAIPESHFQISLKKFEAKWDQNRRPLLYRSTVEVRDNHGKTFTKAIEVNAPLVYRGVKIYQATYGPGVILGHYTDALGQSHPFSVPYQENQMMFFPLKSKSGKPWVGVIRYFVPDFVMGPDNQAGSFSKEPVNPGCYFMVVTRIAKLPPDPKAIHAVGWITNGHPRSFEGIKFYLDRVSLFSGFQMRKDPGVPLVFASFIIILLGVCLTFYVHHKVLRAKLSQEPGGTSLLVTGARKDKEQDYAKEFSRISEILRPAASE